MLPRAAWTMTLSSHPAYHDLGELVLDLVRWSIRIDDCHAARFFGCERQKSSAYLSMKTFCLTIQPIQWPTIGSTSGQAYGNWQVEYEGEIRCESVGCNRIGRLQPLQIEVTSESLIGKRGIGKPVAEDDHATLQCRPDDMRDVLTSGSEHQQGFGLRCNRFVGRRREEDLADRFGG